MRSLIYLFIAVVSLSAGAMVYFGLTFTPIEAALLALIVGLACWLGLELSMRRRAEARLDKAIEDLSRLHARDAVVNEAASEKLDALLARDLGTRVDVLEADVSVLGTVVRQVAESLATIEERLASATPAAGTSLQHGDDDAGAPAPRSAGEADPVIPAEMLSQALDENRLIFHMQPIVTLPRRRTHGYDLVPRLMLEDGELAGPPDFMPRGGGRLVVRIEKLLLQTAITIVRRARASDEPAIVFVPLTRASLADADARRQMLEVLDANRAILPDLVLAIDEAEFRGLGPAEREGLDAIGSLGAGLCLDHARSLRLEFADLARRGVRYIKVEAARFINVPHTLTDFHSADVTAYLARSAISLIARDIAGESQILSLLDDGVELAEGPYVAPPSPIRADLLAEVEDEEADIPVRQVNR